MKEFQLQAHCHKFLLFQTGPDTGKVKVKKGGSYMCHKVTNKT